LSMTRMNTGCIKSSACSQARVLANFGMNGQD
jgi:hypothetical protein